MSRLSLDKYYKTFFKGQKPPIEQLKKINCAHVISFEYFDVRYGKHNITYRDRHNTLIIPVEHIITHEMVIHFNDFYRSSNMKIDSDIASSDYLCDDLDEAIFTAKELYGVEESDWTKK
jgi:hypothetical protein